MPTRLLAPINRTAAFVAMAAVAIILAACSSNSSTKTPTPSVATSAPTVASPSPSAVSSPVAVGSAGAVSIKVSSTPKGNILTDSSGMSLYIWDNDTTPGKSACNGTCATTWPPFTTTAGAAPSGVTGATGAFTLVTRADGTEQIAYNGKPLYHYSGDKAPGDTSGDGVANLWHLAKP